MSKPLTALELHAPGSWQQQLREAIRSPAELAAALELAPQDLPFSAGANASFPLLVPRHFVAQMQKGNPRDPLLLQVLAAPEELVESAGYSRDPVAELTQYAGNTPGLIQKYAGRALLVLTGQCAVNCRYCFRRHFPYADNSLSGAEREATIAALLADPSIQELIVSGGDPLILPDRQLARISEQLAAHRPGMTLRVHSRLPIVIPDRVTEELCAALTRPGMHSVMVLHANHPAELDPLSSHAIGRLRAAGITVLNQSVLLAGVNDSASTLAALSDRLFAAGALPYYLHALDKVAGAAHFDLPLERAQRLLGELAEQRPGYLVPKLMLETPGAGSKRELPPAYGELNAGASRPQGKASPGFSDGHEQG